MIYIYRKSKGQYIYNAQKKGRKTLRMYQVAITIHVQDYVTSTYEMLWAIWYHLCNLKTLNNTHGEVLLLKPVTLLKVTLLHGCFSRF